MDSESHAPRPSNSTLNQPPTSSPASKHCPGQTHHLWEGVSHGPPVGDAPPVTDSELTLAHKVLRAQTLFPSLAISLHLVPLCRGIFTASAVSSPLGPAGVLAVCKQLQRTLTFTATRPVPSCAWPRQHVINQHFNEA